MGSAATLPHSPARLKDLFIKAGVRKFKERLKRKKKVMEHHQTVARPRNGTPGWWATVWCVSTNF